MHSADYVVARCPSVRPSVWPSHAGILSKLLTYPQTVFTFGYPHHSSFSILNGMAIFRRRPALTRVSNASSTKQEAQLSQRDRATLRVIEYFAKSLTQGHSKGVCKSLLVFRWNCLHLLYIYIPFLRYSASKNDAGKPGVGSRSRSMKMAPFDWPYDFLLVRHCKYGSVLYRFRVIRRWIISWPWNMG